MIVGAGALDGPDNGRFVKRPYGVVCCLHRSARCTHKNEKSALLTFKWSAEPVFYCTVRSALSVVRLAPLASVISPTT